MNATRPVQRWVHYWAILTVVTATLLLVLGALVTSYRVGMSDPVWPTEPWYLAVGPINWEEPKVGYLIEHSHRIAGFTLGVVAVVLAGGLIYGEGSRKARRLGLAALLIMLAGYGQFHREMSKYDKTQTAVDVDFTMQTPGLYMTLAGLAALAVWHVAAAVRGSRGWGLRALSSAVLVCVMVQGLLGGLRVMLNSYYGGHFGTQMAAVHGVFAQIVFASMVSLAFLTGRPPQSRPRLASAPLLTTVLVAAALLQLIWGAWIRHLPEVAAQRTHMLTAFAVVGLAVRLAAKAPSTLTGVLIALLGVQLVFGVEAYLSKFDGGLSKAVYAPDAVTPWRAFVRTTHAHVGNWVLTVCVLTSVAAWRGVWRFRSRAAEVPAGKSYNEQPASRTAALAGDRA